MADPGVNTSDLALEASKKALEMAGSSRPIWTSSSWPPLRRIHAALPLRTGSRRAWMRLRRSPSM